MSTAARAPATNSPQSSADHEPARKGAVDSEDPTPPGGREGASRSLDGRLDVNSRPGGSGTNPEQLFAAGWSAFFISAMQVAAGTMKIALPDDVAVDAEVDRIAGDAYDWRRVLMSACLAWSAMLPSG